MLGILNSQRYFSFLLQIYPRHSGYSFVCFSNSSLVFITIFFKKKCLNDITAWKIMFFWFLGTPTSFITLPISNSTVKSHITCYMRGWSFSTSYRDNIKTDLNQMNDNLNKMSIQNVLNLSTCTLKIEECSLCN